MITRFKNMFLIITLLSVSPLVAQQGAVKQIRALISEGKNKEAVEMALEASAKYTKDPEVHYILAYAMFKNGQIDAALEEAKTVFVEKPKYAFNRKLLMDIYILKENFAAALPECEFLIKEASKELSYHTSLAEIYIGLDQFEKATIELEKLNLQKPNDNRILTLLGDVYAKQRVNGRAIEYYNKALGVSTDAIETKLKLAKLYFREQQYSDALKQYLDVVRLDSNNTDGNLYCGYIYFSAGKTNVQEYGKAIFYLNKYIGLKPADYQGFFYLGKSWHALRNWKNATTNLETAIQKDDSSKIKDEATKLLAESLVGVGGGYRKAGDTINMIATYEKAISLNREYFPLYQEIGAMYYSSKNYPEAVKWLDKRTTASPSDSTAATPWFLLGVSKYYAAKSHADSLRSVDDIKKSLQLKPSVNNYITLGGILRTLDSLAAARAAYEKAVALDSTNSKVYSELGVLIFNTPKSNMEEVISSFNTAIRLDLNGSNKTAYYFLGLSYMRAKKLPLAKNAFKKYIELDPNGPYVKSANDNIKKIK